MGYDLNPVCEEIEVARKQVYVFDTPCIFGVFSQVKTCFYTVL